MSTDVPSAPIAICFDANLLGSVCDGVGFWAFYLSQMCTVVGSIRLKCVWRWVLKALMLQHVINSNIKIDVLLKFFHFLAGHFIQHVITSLYHHMFLRKILNFYLHHYRVTVLLSN